MAARELPETAAPKRKKAPKAGIRAFGASLQNAVSAA